MSSPELRFPEFKKPWAPAHAGDAFVHSKAKGEAGLPIWSVTLDRGLVPRDSLDRRMGADAADESNLRAQPGDLVYNMMRMWQGAVGMVSEECMVSPAYVVLSPKEGIESRFFDHWFKNKRMLYLLWAYSYGLTEDRLRLYFNDFSRIPLALPEEDEQKKIVEILDASSEKISLLTEKKTALEEYKHGVMQRLFSRALRFTRDDGSAFPDWQERKLGGIIEVCYGKDHKHLKGGDIPVLGSGGIMRYVDTALAAGPAIVLGRKGTIDKPRFVDGPFWTVDTLFYSKVKYEHVPEFVFAAMQMVNWLRYNEATGVPSLSASAIKKVRIEVPTDPQEQRKIADFLSAIDAKIEAVSAQISEMETFKKGLLQKMFV